MAAPVFVSATVNAAGTELAITFDQNVNLGASVIPLITVGGRIVAGALTGLSRSGAVVTGTITTAGLGGPVRAGETVTVTSPLGVAVDTATGLLLSVLATAQAVTNGSTVAVSQSHFYRQILAGTGGPNF